MKSRKIKNVIENTVHVVLIILSFFAALYLFISLIGYGEIGASGFYTITINKFIFKKQKGVRSCNATNYILY